MATEELHEVVQYKGRDVCSCGDLNCASLDVNPTLNTTGPLNESPERLFLMDAYPNAKWRTRVRRMSDAQVTAVYLRLKQQGISKEKK